MYSNQISPFEYVSILVSIILGLGITQILASFSDLLYDYKKIRFYWPHTCWVVFILFLHIQDWFIIYQLKDMPAWHLPELFFILLYPISLFCVAKMLLSANKKEERFNMKLFYTRHFPLIFIMVGVTIIISILFNLFILKINLLTQVPLILFLIAMLYATIKNYKNENFHKALAIAIISGSLLSIMLNENSWVIK
ncbi:MAG: hypothetical protein ABI685_10105 [Ferruginibacter sp.]